MIIEGVRSEDIELTVKNRLFRLKQEPDVVLFEKNQAAQLIEVLQKWIDGEEIE
jgi:hypothetical protein